MNEKYITDGVKDEIELISLIVRKANQMLFIEPFEINFDCLIGCPLCLKRKLDHFWLISESKQYYVWDFRSSVSRLAQLPEGVSGKEIQKELFGTFIKVNRHMIDNFDLILLSQKELLK